MPSYKLVYFDGKGRAETIRLAFVLAGIKFEDVRLSKEEWHALKPKSFSGKVPYLEVDGKVLVESMAIARYVAREGGLLGKSSFEEAVVDSAVEVVTNMYLKFISTKFAPEGHKEAAKQEFAEKHLVYASDLLEKFLGDKMFLVTDEITLADLHFFAIFEFLTDFHWEQSHPKLKALRERVAAQPRVAEYLTTRPESVF